MNPSSITIKIEFGQDGSGTTVKEVSAGDAAPAPSAGAGVHADLTGSIPTPDMTLGMAGAQENIPTPFSGGGGLQEASAAPSPELNPEMISGSKDEEEPPRPEEA